MQTQVQPRTVTVKGFIAETGTRTTTTYKMISNGELPVIRTGRRILIARDTVERFLRGELTPTHPQNSDDQTENH